MLKRISITEFPVWCKSSVSGKRKLLANRERDADETGRQEKEEEEETRRNPWTKWESKRRGIISGWRPSCYKSKALAYREAIGKGTLPWAISFFLNKKKINILNIALFIEVIYWIQILLKKKLFQSWAILQVHGYLFCISSTGISSTEYLKYFKKLCISNKSVFQVPVFPVLPVLFFLVFKKKGLTFN